MSYKVKDFVNDVVNVYPDSTINYVFDSAAEIDAKFDPDDKIVPVQLRIEGFHFSVAELRKLAKILNKTADAVEEYFQNN